MPTRSNTFYGWRPDLPDHRDHAYAAPRKPRAGLPAKVDLRGANMPPVWDQGSLGSCTAHAIGAALVFESAKAGKPAFMPSRLMIYFEEREVEGTIESDAGAEIRDGIKCVKDQGACDEVLWPYDESRFALKPSSTAYTAALAHEALSYQRVGQNHEQLRGCLADGHPFVFGFTVYESFESLAVAKSGSASLPKRGESAVGGHAVLAVGYDDARQRYLIRNSWGADWGIKGYFTLPYAYVTNNNLADDFWTLRV